MMPQSGQSGMSTSSGSLYFCLLTEKSGDRKLRLEPGTYQPGLNRWYSSSVGSKTGSTGRPRRYIRSGRSDGDEFSDPSDVILKPNVAEIDLPRDWLAPPV